MSSSPVAQRIISLDVLRGFALLGILIMNIQLFAMPTATYINPYAFGDMQGVNYVVWLFQHLFADQKFMTLFSMLFGVGILVFSENAEARGLRPAPLHYLRNFWLLMFGLIHGYFLWHGDILFTYALCAFVVFWFRHKSVTTLVVSGLVMISIASGLSLLTGFAIPHLPQEAITGMAKSWTPEQSLIQAEISAYTGGYLSALAERIDDTLFMQTYMFVNTFFWRAGGVMLLGMALYKRGFFTLEFSTKHYLLGAIVTLAIGFLLIFVGVRNNIAHDFSLQYSMFIGNQYNYWGSLLVGLGYACLMMMWVKSKLLQGVKSRLAQIGKTAFSNYIFHTLICSLLFYQLGYMGTFGRMEQLITVMAICLLQLLLTPLWLSRFKYGPLEWLWRSLTYKAWQPMRHVTASL